MTRRNPKAKKPKRDNRRPNGATPPPEFMPNEHLAEALMDWLGAVGRAIQAQRGVEELCACRSWSAQRTSERAARGEEVR